MYAIVLRVAWCAAISTVLLAGCARAAGDPGTLVAASYEEPDTLSPVTANLALDNDEFNLIYDGLVRIDDAGRAVPDLALQVPSRTNGGISPDGRTITYHLRRGVRWHDGAPFTAGDVLYTWRRLMDPHVNVPTRGNYAQIATMSAPDLWTVRMQLRRPFAPFAYLFACEKQGAIVAAHLHGSDAPIGTGPYEVVGWHRGDDLILRRNPYYWRRPSIERLVVRFIANQSTILSALQTGEVQLYTTAAPEQIEQLRLVRGVNVAQAASAHWEHLTFNLRPGTGPQTDARVRKAIAYSIDVPEIYHAIYHGVGGLAPLDQAPWSWARANGVRYYPHDFARAARLLERAGWKLRSDGYRYKNAQRLTLAVSSTTGMPQRQSVEVLLQQQLRAAGIDLTIRNVRPELLLAGSQSGLLYSGKFQLALFAYQEPTPDPDDHLYVSAGATPPGGQNMSAYVNAAVSEASLKAARIYDVTERKLLYESVQRTLIDDLPFYTLVWEPEIDAYSRRLIGVRPAPAGSDYWNVMDWRLVGTKN